MLALWMSLAHAGGLDDQFPQAPVAEADMIALTAKIAGSPATVYDAVTATPDAATPLEHDVEARLAKKLRPAPDTLRRYGHAMLTLSAKGPVPDNVRWFLAEHVGLPTVPIEIGRFVSGNDAEGMAKMLKDLDLDIPDLRTIAVVTEPITGGVRGVVVGLVDVADFEPFPRVWSVGDVAGVPGTLLDRGNAYALYVATGEATVQKYDIKDTEGRFNIDVPLPATPGAYRVAMASRSKRNFGETFFFTLYVDTPPPTAPMAIPDPPNVGDPDDAFLAELNAERTKYGLVPLERRGDRERLRTYLDKLPVSEVGQLRAWRAFSRTDPVPDVPHGTWEGVGATSSTIAEAGWMATQHPIDRASLLDPDARYVLEASTARGGERKFTAILLHPTAGIDDVRARALDAMTQRMGSKPATGEVVPRQLDAIAAKVAAGETSLNAAMKQVDHLVHAGQKSGDIGGAVTMTAFTLPPGKPWDLSAVNLPPGARSVAIGAATGTMGRKDGLSFDIVLIVIATGDIQ
jgi:hypothetical protein